MYKISVIIVTYNRLKLLKSCLEHLLQQDNVINYVYVVNNNSKDNTKKYLNKIKNNMIIPINLSKNIGGAGGFSYGLNYACNNDDSDYFLVMDDDTLLCHNSISALLKKVKLLHNNFGFLCSNVRFWKDKSPSLINIPVVDKDWNKKVKDGLIKVQSASFVSLLIPRQIINKLGLPIADMFIWADDVEYTTRISRRFPSYFVSDSVVLHKGFSNDEQESVLNVPMKRLIYYKCMFRNRLYIYRKYYNYKYFIVKLLSYLFILFSIPFKAHNHKIHRMLSTLCGIWNGLIFNPKIKYPK